MATKKEQIQRFARHLREKLRRDVTAVEVAEELQKQGWPMPKPKTPLELLAREIARAESEEMLYDEVLNEAYNANIYYYDKVADKVEMLWGDTDRASRDKVVKNMTLHRDHLVGEAYQATINLMHWNRIHPNEEPVQMELDFGPDVQWRLNGPRGREKAS